MTPATILITGATGAIGSALAEQYARSGVTLVLFGRDQQRLDLLAEQCRQRGSQVNTVLCDMRDHRLLMECLAEVCLKEVPDLVIANAGVSVTAHEQGEQWEQIETVIGINLLATMATVQAVLPAMRKRGRGQIALISSLAAWYGLPVTPSYAASKAAIKNYGESLRIALADEGIKVSVVLPGFVRSAMSRSVPGPKPLLMDADQAARQIRTGLVREKKLISFPFPLSLGCRLLAVMPTAVADRLISRFGYRG